VTQTIETAKTEIQKAVDVQFNTLRATIFSNRQETYLKIEKLEATLKNEIQAVQQINQSASNHDTQSRINYLEA
jgi:hypothetical protein